MASQFFDDRQQTRIQTMRREELRVLAKKYNIGINPKGPKWKMIPLMEQAEEQGIFNHPPPVIVPEVKEYTVEHMGVKRGWCVLDGDSIHQSNLPSKEEALASFA